MCMINRNDMREERWQAGLVRTLHRLNRRSHQRIDDPQLTLTTTRAYNDFKDRLMAAGYARALARPEQEVRDHLRLAGQAAVKVFRWHGTNIREITHLPSFETERSIDDSTINPETFVEACYALLAAKAEELLGELWMTAQEAGLFNKEEDEPEARAVAQALGHIVSGKPDRLERAQAALSAAIGAKGRWGNEARCLDLIIRGVSVELENCLKEFQHTLDRAFVDAGSPDAPARLLALPILGLRALVARSV